MQTFMGGKTVTIEGRRYYLELASDYRALRGYQSPIGEELYIIEDAVVIDGRRKPAAPELAPDEVFATINHAGERRVWVLHKLGGWYRRWQAAAVIVDPLPPGDDGRTA